jgi:hypothetical protein
VQQQKSGEMIASENVNNGILRNDKYIVIPVLRMQIPALPS